MDDPGGRVTDGSAARGRTTNRPVFLSPGKLYWVYKGLSRKGNLLHFVWTNPVGWGLKVNRPKAERSHPGVCPRRSFSALYSCKGASRVSPCGARYFPSDGKVPKGSPGDAAGANFVRHDGFPYPLWPFGSSPPDRGSRPPVPHYGGRVPAGFYRISGAQNLSGVSQFNPGHWALGLQKLSLLRLQFRALLGRVGGGWCCAVGRGLLDAPHKSTGRPVSGPYERKDRFLIRRRGGS